MPVRNRIAEWLPEITAWRQDLHAHPELRFEEHRTAGLVAARLREFGCDEVVEGVAKTGVVGVIRGRGARAGKVLGFRADMDALPILEQTGLGHASTISGKMHACGHDGHTSMLLGAAKYLAETRNFDGTVVLIFQPAEEGGGGARGMIADGMIERFGIQEVYGMHNWPGLPSGSFAIRSGAQMAGADAFQITVKGRGGHGAQPHTTVDATLAGAAVVMALQSITSRNVDPLNAAVVSVCSFHSDTNIYNVIADQVILLGTTRTFDADTRDLIEHRLIEIAQTAAQTYGAVAEVIYTRGAPPLLNAPEQAEVAAAAAESVAGSVKRDLPPAMPAEDFADFLAVRPGAYMFIGNGESAALHNPAYEFNDDIIPAGSSWFATLAEQRMPLT